MLAMFILKIRDVHVVKGLAIHILLDRNNGIRNFVMYG